MSKALVIKGANFTANKVTTVELENVIPCTGLSITPTTKAFDTLGATQQITATITPSNTTDTVYYVSSNESVATVSDTGLITCVGVGSATITVTCGEQSATCAVTSEVTVVLDDVYYAENGYQYSGSLELPTKDHIGRSSDSRSRLYYQTTEYGTYRVFVQTSNAGKYAIQIPSGTATITVKPPEGMRSWTRLVLADVNTKQTYVTGADGESAKGIKVFAISDSDTLTCDITNYTTANGFIASVRAPEGQTASEVTGKTTVIFS